MPERITLGAQLVERNPIEHEIVSDIRYVFEEFRRCDTAATRLFFNPFQVVALVA
jgi:hypothetical protein